MPNVDWTEVEIVPSTTWSEEEIAPSTSWKEVIEEFELIKMKSNDCIGIFRSGSEKPWYLKYIIEQNFNLNNLQNYK